MGRITWNYDGIGDMLRSPGMQAAMLARAEVVMARAIAIAPEDPHSRHRGRYKASFGTDSGIRHTGATSRAYGRVYNSAPEALAVEFGTRNNPAHHTLIAALDAVAYVEGQASIAKFRPVPT